MHCIKCGKKSYRSFMVREGVPPIDPNDPKTPDHSSIRPIGFCRKHWFELQKFLGLV